MRERIEIEKDEVLGSCGSDSGWATAKVGRLILETLLDIRDILNENPSLLTSTKE